MTEVSAKELLKRLSGGVRMAISKICGVVLAVMAAMIVPYVATSTSSLYNKGGGSAHKRAVDAVTDNGKYSV